MLLKLSKLFGVSTDVLLGNSIKKEPTQKTESQPQDSMEVQVMGLVGQLAPDNKKMLIAQLEFLQQEK